MSEVYPNDRALEFANNAASKAVYKPYDISQEEDGLYRVTV